MAVRAYSATDVASGPEAEGGKGKFERVAKSGDLFAVVGSVGGCLRRLLDFDQFSFALSS